MQNPSVRALIVASLSLGFTACTVGGETTHLQHQDMSSMIEARYMSGFAAQNKEQEPYVLLAQNNATPHLRGMLPPSHHLDEQYYPNYQTGPYNHGVPNARQQHNAITRQNFSYQLDQSLSVPVQQHVVSPQADIASTYNQNYGVAQTPNWGMNSGAEPQYFASPEPKTSYTPHLIVNTVKQSVNTARSQSPRVAIEGLKIQEAEESYAQAKAQSRFKLSLDGVAGISQSETNFAVVNRTDSDTRLQRSASLDLSLPIFQGGGIRAQKNVAKTGIETARANFDIVQSAVSQETAIAHLNVIRDRELIQIYKRNVDLLENQKQTVQALVRAGESTVADEAIIEARLASIQARLELAGSDLAASESSYKKLVGRPAPRLMPVGSVELPNSLQEIKDAVKRNNAQLRSVETQAEAAFHNIAVAKSLGRPKLSLQGVLRAGEGQSETIRRSSAAEVLLNLNVPLLSGGENKSRVRQAALAQSRAILETRELHNNLNERLEQLWGAVQSARRSKVPNQAQKTASLRAYEVINKQRAAGLATSLDVLSVEQSLLDAEINILEAQTKEDISRFQLLGLMGAI